MQTSQGGTSRKTKAMVLRCRVQNGVAYHVMEEKGI